MSAQPKMLLVACSGEETTQLAKDMQTILRSDYGLDNHVELLLSLRRRELDKGTGKDHRAPLLMDYFSDMEVEVALGRNVSKDVIQGKHIVIVEHLLTPERFPWPNARRVVGPNDHKETVLAFLDAIGHVETLQRTLLAPYLTYVRPHSVRKYLRRGHIQADTLSTTLERYKRAGLDAIVTIDPHSEKAAELSEALEMDFYKSNPFHSGRAINPFELGLRDGNTSKVLRELRPFQERFANLKKEYNSHVYVVCVDAGTKKRCENFTERAFPELEPEEFYKLIVFFNKDRVSYGDPTTAFEPFSEINEKNIDPEGVYIIIDDMYSSGKTCNNVAKILKQCGAKRIEAWTSHPVTTSEQYDSANDRKYIDLVVCLDTVPQTKGLNIEVIPATAHLCAAEVYKVHQALVKTR